MKIEIKTHGDKQYQVTETGTYYHIEAEFKVIEVIEKCRANDTHIRVFYGDRETGNVWPETNDVTGYISRSTGPVKIPILKKSTTSDGGGAILDHCIMKIRDSKGNVLYKSANYNEPVIEIKPNGDKYELLYNGEIIGANLTTDSAEKLKKELQ